MASIIRFAAEADCDQIAEIYAPFVTSMPTSFEAVAPSPDEIAQRMRQSQEAFPWLVCVDEDLVQGYVYASQHRQRTGYQWCADVAVYIREGHRGRGIGKALYTALFELLRAQGYVNAYAGIALPNAGSVGLHESMGFRLVGVYENVGYKLGAWHDVGWWHLPLQDRADNPKKPLPVASLSEPVRVLAIEQGAAILSYRA